VYRSCSWREKREVLDAFWRTRDNSSDRINQAALEYGPYAVASLVVIVLELVPVMIYTVERGNAFGWLSVVAELAVLASLWWSVVRWRSLKTRYSARFTGAQA